MDDKRKAEILDILIPSLRGVAEEWNKQADKAIKRPGGHSDAYWKAYLEGRLSYYLRNIIAIWESELLK